MLKNLRAVARRVLARTAIVAAVVIVGWPASGLGSAGAAQPNNLGCLGKDFSTYARYGSEISGPGAEFGQFNASLAQVVPGLGLPIQVHLAGLIPDDYVINTCNNP